MNDTYFLNFGDAWKAAIVWATDHGFKPESVQPFILRAYGSLITGVSSTEMQLVTLDNATPIAGSNLLGKLDGLICVGGKQSVVTVLTGDIPAQSIHYGYPDDIEHAFAGEFKSVLAALQSGLMSINDNNDKNIFRDLLTSYFLHVPQVQKTATDFPSLGAASGPWADYRPFLQPFMMGGDGKMEVKVKLPVTTGIGGDTATGLNYYCFEIGGVLLKNQAKAVGQKVEAQGNYYCQ